MVLPTSAKDDEEDVELRVAFDFDGVLADDEAEKVYQMTGDVDLFQHAEMEKVATPHNPGPLQDLIIKMAFFQKLEMKKASETKGYKPALRIAIVTARDAPANERLVTTLNAWGLTAIEAFFLGGIEKKRILSVLKPHIFFDDQMAHLEPARLMCPLYTFRLESEIKRVLKKLKKPNELHRINDLIKLKTLAQRGYFPKELPPPFNSIDYGHDIGQLLSKWRVPPKKPTSAATHYLARKGKLRRKLAILNPINFAFLSDCILRNWKDIANVYAQSKLSISKPIPDKKRRKAILWEHHWNELPKVRTRVRSGSRYIIRTDVSNCYPSIYSHSLAWALHGKATAKAKMHDPSLFGNILDKLARSGQDSQSIGLPIGPDTSIILSELILCALDVEIQKLPFMAGFRHVDDYEFSFRSLAEAEFAMARLHGILSDYQLQLNQEKTKILILPQVIEKPWATRTAKSVYR